MLQVLFATFLLSNITQLNPRDPYKEPFIAIVCEDSLSPSDPVAAFSVKPTQNFNPKYSDFLIVPPKPEMPTFLPFLGACLGPFQRTQHSITDQNGDVQTLTIQHGLGPSTFQLQRVAQYMRTTRYIREVTEFLEQQACEQKWGKYIDDLLIQNPGLRDQLFQNLKKLINKHNQEAMQKGASWEATFVDPKTLKGKCQPKKPRVQKPASAFSRMSRRYQ